MPFVKRDAAAPPAADQLFQDSAAAAIANLKNPQAEARWSAARSLGSCPEAVPALAVALGMEQVSRVREAIMTALIRIGDEASVRAMLPYLRSQDAGLRAATIEALQSSARMRFRHTSINCWKTATPMCGSWPRSWLETCRQKMPRKRCADCWNTNNIPMSVRPPSSFWRRSEHGTPFRRSSPAPNDLLEFRFWPLRRRRPSPGFQTRKAEGEMSRSEARGTRPVRVTDEETRRFCEFLYRRTGMMFADNKRYYIDRRLAERIAATDSPSFQAYFATLRSDFQHEIEHLVNAFTVNETYFYREDHQLRCMTSDLLGNIISRKKPGEAIRIWSIPCSSGEEPYSIAIWMMENWKEVDQLQYRDRRLGHRHSRAQGCRGRHLWQPRPHAALARSDRPLFCTGGR